MGLVSPASFRLLTALWPGFLGGSRRRGTGTVEGSVAAPAWDDCHAIGGPSCRAILARSSGVAVLGGEADWSRESSCVSVCWPQ